jgi:hypothetical protein
MQADSSLHARLMRPLPSPSGSMHIIEYEPHCHAMPRMQSEAQQAERPPTPEREPPGQAGQEEPLSSITFEVSHHVKYGQKLKVVGSPEALGSWDCAAAPGACARRRKGSSVTWQELLRGPSPSSHSLQ